MWKLPKIDFKGVRDYLKTLPAIAFALMLGAGMVMTAYAIWNTWILAHGSWLNSEAVAVARVNGIAVALWIALGLIGLVIVALAFGKIQSLTVNTPTGIGGTVEFEHDEEPPAT